MNNQIKCAAKLESLPVLREFIKTSCQVHGKISASVLYDLQLAVDEACTNVITHGKQGEANGEIVVGMEFQPEQVVVEITDFGAPFEPNNAPKPDLETKFEQRKPGGFGMDFIYRSMDEVQYETSQAGNRLTFIKKFTSKEDHHAHSV